MGRETNWKLLRAFKSVRQRFLCRMQKRLPSVRQQSADRCENSGQKEDSVHGQRRQTATRNRETEKRSE